MTSRKCAEFIFRGKARILACVALRNWICGQSVTSQYTDRQPRLHTNIENCLSFFVTAKVNSEAQTGSHDFHNFKFSHSHRNTGKF